MSLIEHPSGGYRFLPGIAPYSCGVVAAPRHEIVQVTLQQPRPYRDGFEAVDSVLREFGCARTDLCAISLRSPKPYSFDGFAEFNDDYAEILRGWGVFVDEMNPIARTNVAPVVEPPREPLMYGFSFARLADDDHLPPTFVVAGAGELPEGSLQAQDIAARGDLTERGIRTKAEFVMQLMTNRLRGLHALPSQLTMVNVYTEHPLRPFLKGVVLEALSGAAIHGVHWHYSRPPIEEIEFEMDMRGVRTELRR